jgi:peptide/nickel transport system ATP-binding protein
VRPAHRKIDPKLEPVGDDPRHLVACLLASDTRRSLWSALQAGERPEAAREEVGLEPDAQEPPAEAADVEVEESA